MKYLKSALTITILVLVNALFLTGCEWTTVDKADDTVKTGKENVEKDSEEAKVYLEQVSEEKIADKVVGVILPHHLLVEGFMDRFYQQLSEKLKTEKREIARVILISPNHFGYGYNFIQSTDVWNEKNFDVRLDSSAIRALKDKGAFHIEPKYFPMEHGVTTHFSFLKKYFPEVEIVPIILKRDIKKEQLDVLKRELMAIYDEKQTLVMASIDFSHYSAEEMALKNDFRMVKWLGAMGDCENISESECGTKNFIDIDELYKSYDTSVDGAVGVDSPESIYLMNSLMRGLGAKKFNLWRRTSSGSLIGAIDAKENTSHLFGSYGL